MRMGRARAMEKAAKPVETEPPRAPPDLAERIAALAKGFSLEV